MSVATEPGTVVTLPLVREAPAQGLAELLAEVRAMADEHLDDWADDAGGDEDGHDEDGHDEDGYADEYGAQDLALIGESANLRARADRFASAVEAGTMVDADEIESVLRAFRSYEPLLDARDRGLNAAAYRRLVGATAPARRQVA